MKTILGTRFLDIPDGVTVTCKARHVTVTGPRGKLERSFKHVQLDMRMVSPQKLRVDLWFGTRKQVATIRTICSPSAIIAAAGAPALKWKYEPTTQSRCASL